MNYSRDSIKTLLQSCTLESLRTKASAMVPGLSRMIGYQCVDEQLFPVGIESVKVVLNDIWKHRGAGANKDNVAIMCTFAAAGQGKTELCLQLMLNTTLHLNLTGVQQLVAIHITFGQDTSFNSELDSTPVKSVAWRVVRSLSSTQVPAQGTVDCYDNLWALVADVRDSLKGTLDTKEFGILLCVDEILKVAVANPDLCRNLLDQLGALQQCSLTQEIPTFVMITGLFFDAVIKDFRTKFGRPLKLVALPMLASISLESVANTISNALVSVAKFDRSYTQVFNAEVKRLVLWIVYVTGKSFRALEKCVDRLFQILVSAETLASFSEANPTSVMNCFVPNTTYHCLDQVKWKDGTVRNVLSSSFLTTVIAPLDDSELFHYCCDIFCDLVYHYDKGSEDNYECIENEMMIKAQSLGVIFIKRRNADHFNLVQPRVSLPYLFAASKAICVANGLPYGNNFGFTSSADDLKNLLPVLLANIGIGIYSLTARLPTSFEFTIPYVELFRIHVLTIKQQSGEKLNVYDILPGALVKHNAGTAEVATITAVDVKISAAVDIDAVASDDADTASVDIDVAAFITESPICPLLQLTIVNTEKKSHPKKSNVSWMIEKQNNVNAVERPVFLIESNSQQTQGIDYVGRHFIVNDEGGRDCVLLWLTSMKLREANTVTSLLGYAKRIHDVASAAGLQSDAYFAVLYGCWRTGDINMGALPSKTVVVAAETILRMFRPFGGGCLELIVREKSLP